MPIAGVVITTRPDDLQAARARLAAMDGVEIHGADAAGHIVAVLDCADSAALERLTAAINACPLILHAGLTFLNMEDVLDAAAGEPAPTPIAEPGQGA